MYHMVKNLPVMQEMQVQSLGWEDPLEKGMAPYFSILAKRFSWTEEPDRLYSPWGHKKVRQDFHFFFFFLVQTVLHGLHKVWEGWAEV